jgi:hypothetical protein
MGNFYANLTLRGPEPKAVAKAMKGRGAFVTPNSSGCIVVLYDDDVGLAEVAQRLSKKFCCPALAVFNHDDDVLFYMLYDNGVQVDQYNSSPGYFAEDEDAPVEPQGGNIETLCALFKVGDRSTVERALRDEYHFAFERHKDLAHALGLPEFAAGLSYEDAMRGDLPDDLKKSDLIHVK